MQRGCVIFIIAASLAILVASVILRIFFMPAYQQKGTASIIGIIDLAIDEHKKDFGLYPEGANEAIAKILLGANTRNKQYIPQDSIVIRHNKMIDLWKRPLHVKMKGMKPTVVSSGENGVFGDSDDLTGENWKNY